MNSSNSFNMLIILLFIHIYFVYWHECMKINIINFENLDKYQRLIKKKTTLSTLSMKTRLCLKGTFTLSVDLLWFGLIYRLKTEQFYVSYQTPVTIWIWTGVVFVSATKYFLLQ